MGVRQCLVDGQIIQVSSDETSHQTTATTAGLAIHHHHQQQEEAEGEEETTISAPGLDIICKMNKAGEQFCSTRSAWG